MPSMSYCMFENTETELRQVVDSMMSATTMADLDLSDYERQAFLRMWHLTRVFLAEHERLLNSEPEPDPMMDFNYVGSPAHY